MERIPIEPRSPDRAGTDTPPDKLIDVDLVLHYAGFVAKALRRHFTTAAATFVLIFGAIWMTASLWPKTYQADGRLLVQRNDVMASLVNPGRTIPRETEDPTRAAEEIVHGRQILLAIIKETNLLSEWDRTRPLLLRLKDRALRLFGGGPTEEERIDGLVGLLESRLQIGATPEGAVSFVLRWPDPQMANQIVDKAMQNFLKDRRVNEMSAIADSIAILDAAVEALETQVNATLSQLPGRAQSGTPRPPSARQGDRQPVDSAGFLPRGPSAEAMVRLARLKSALDSRQQEVARLEAVRAQQLTEAQARLSAAQAVYTEGHPTVLALRQTVSQLSRETAELAASRRDARSLEAEYDSLSVETERASQIRANSSRPRSAVPFDFSGVLNAGDPSEPISLRLKVEMTELAAVRERANAARAELSSTQAGFKYQYRVLRPPQVPRRPIAPNLPAILFAGAVASLLIAVAVAVTVDVTGVVLLETWPFKRVLGVPVTPQIPKL